MSTFLHEVNSSAARFQHRAPQLGSSATQFQLRAPQLGSSSAQFQLRAPQLGSGLFLYTPCINYLTSNAAL
jgi:hypothetical protein